MALGEFHHCIQVKIDESLETFSAEQRFHGEGLDTIESLGRGRCGLVFFGQLQLHWAIVHPTSASAVVSDVHTRICAPDSLAHDCLYPIVRSENSSTGRQAVSVAMLGCFSDISMALGELHHCIQVALATFPWHWGSSIIVSRSKLTNRWKHFLPSSASMVKGWTQ